MTKFLKYLNSIPFRFTIKHYQVFGESKKDLRDNALVSVESWDTLRENHPHFSISSKREEWLKAVNLEVVKDGQDKGLVSRSRDIVNLFKREKIKSVFSVGVGGAGLEYNIKKQMPELNIFCSEYSEKNVEVLKKVFVEANSVVVFDILKGDWQAIKNTYLQNSSNTLLMYRLDAGFTNEEWREIFESIYNSGVERIVYIPTTLLTAFSVFNRKKRELGWFLKKEPVSLAGYLRTKKEFESFWDGLYEKEDVVFGGLKSFYLKRLEK